jgi:hypothetical protein
MKPGAFQSDLIQGLRRINLDDPEWAKEAVDHLIFLNPVIEDTKVLPESRSNKNARNKYLAAIKTLEQSQKDFRLAIKNKDKKLRGQAINNMDTARKMCGDAYKLVFGAKEWNRLAEREKNGDVEGEPLLEAPVHNKTSVSNSN